MNSVHYDCSYSLFRETAVPTIREGRNNATGNSAKPCVVKPRHFHLARVILRARYITHFLKICCDLLDIRSKPLFRFLMGGQHLDQIRICP